MIKRYLWVILLTISCPRGVLNEPAGTDYLIEAAAVYQRQPIYAYHLLTGNPGEKQWGLDGARILIQLYLDQREYERAAQLLDSLDWAVELPPGESQLIMLKTNRWQRLSETTHDCLLKGIAYYHLEDYQKAVEFLSKPGLPDDYRKLNLARAHCYLNKFGDAFAIFLDIDSLSPYLAADYQNLLLNILFNISDLSIIEQGLGRLREPSLREFVILKLYEKQDRKDSLTAMAWRLISKYPESSGAAYALKFATPKTGSEHKLFGRASYHHGDYDMAVDHLSKSPPDAETDYYLGRIYYERGHYTKALDYLSKSDWGAAYYYRGRTLENLDRFNEAIAVYDSLTQVRTNSSYARRGISRKAFLLEDIGDTLRAIETFLKIGDKNTKFRAAMQLVHLGKMAKAKEILGDYTAPEFVYWHARVREHLGESAESLKIYLNKHYPLSYYSLVLGNNNTIFDSVPLSPWIDQLGDSTHSLDVNDSLHIKNAIRYFGLNEVAYGVEELKMIEANTPKDLAYLSDLCTSYGVDPQSIIYLLKIKDMAFPKNTGMIPKEFFHLLYPIRYLQSIMEQGSDLSLILAMIWQESLFDPGALSPAKAKGLMQIIPETARKIARETSVPDYTLDDASTSIRFGCYYLNKMLEEFHSVPLALAAYNAGPVRVRRWLARNPDAQIDEFIELIPYAETREYVKSVLARQRIYDLIIGDQKYQIKGIDPGSAN